jgi:hypothetical protein
MFNNGTRTHVSPTTGGRHDQLDDIEQPYVLIPWNGEIAIKEY